MAINYHNHNISTSGTFTASSGNFTTLIVNGTSVSDFNSSVSGLLPAVSGSGYAVSSFNSTNNRYTISVTGLQPSGNYANSVHSHGNISSSGTIGSVSEQILITNSSGLISTTGTLNANKIIVSDGFGSMAIYGDANTFLYKMSDGGNPDGWDYLITYQSFPWSQLSNVPSTFNPSSHSHTVSDITNFNSSVSGLLPVKNIISGSGTLVSSSSGIYTINVDIIDCGEVLAPPNAPTNLLATSSNASLALSWTAPTYAGSTAITGHTVEYTPSGGSPSTINTNSASGLYTLSGLTNGTSYNVRVRAINSIGNGSYSNAVSGTPAQANLLSLNNYYWKHYLNSPSADPMGTSFNGAGSSASPATGIIGTNYPSVGTNYYGDARMWMSVVAGGTLSYTLTYKNPGGYNGGALLYKTSVSPSQHNQSLQDAITNFTLINSASNSNSAGTITTQTGTVSVNTGDYIVLRWYQDDGSTLIPESKVIISITP